MEVAVEDRMVGAALEMSGGGSVWEEPCKLTVVFGLRGGMWE